MGNVSSSHVGNKAYSSGHDTTIVNFYGTDYAAAKTDASQVMDPSKFTQPIVDIAKGPALKSPTVEECGYSDRIMQLTAGNSTLTTQEAANAVVAYGVWPSFSEGSGEAIDRMSRPGPSVDRFYTLDSIDYTTSFTGYYWRLPGSLADLGMFGQNCFYHFLMRSGFLVHLQLNASKFHQGCIILAAIPECQFGTATDGNRDSGALPNSFFTEYPLHQLTIYPHQLVNLRTNNSATLVLPYINSVPAENALTHNYWTIVVAPIVQLAYSSGASTTVPMTVSIAPMFAEFSGLRNSVPVTQGVPVFQIPGSEQFITTLRNEGYPLYPEFEATHDYFIPGEVRNLLEVCQVDTFCYVGTKTNRTELEVGVKTNTPVLSVTTDLSDQFFSTTYLGRCAKWFAHYRGSIRVTFTFCGSAMATGKFLIAYTPPGGDAPPSRQAAMLGTHMVWDIGLQSSVTFIVPWIAQTQYRFPNTTPNIYSFSGYITMWYQTSIVVPPGAPQTCAITAMAGACEDFEFRLVTDNAYYQGLTDDVGKIVTGSLNKALQKIDTVASKGSETDGIEVTTGDSNALTATETGAASTTDPGTVMETRDSHVTFSGRESCVENFLSRYAQVYSGYLNFGQTGLSSYSRFFLAIPLTFNDATTLAAIRSKYAMFTYVRANYDFVVLVDVIDMQSGSTALEEGSEMVKRIQMCFIPPGGPTLTSNTDQRWTMPTIPSIYFNSNGIPASFRLPFMSVAHAFRTRFDGFSTFNKANYGTDPGNLVGTLYMREVGYADGNSTRQKSYRATVRVLARPVNIRTWVPRPIVSKATTTRSLVRMMDVQDEDEIDIEPTAGPFGTDVFHSYGDDDMETDQSIEETLYEENLMHLSSMPRKYREWLSMCPVYESLSKDGSHGYYYAIPLSHNMFVTNYHTFMCRDIKFITGGIKSWSLWYYNFERDIVICTVQSGTLRKIPMCDCPAPKEAWVGNDREGAVWLGSGYPREEAIMSATKYYGEHRQYGLIQFQATVKEGWCSSPVFCQNGVCGFITAGCANATLATSFYKVDRLHEMEIEDKECYEMNYVFADIRAKKAGKGKPQFLKNDRYKPYSDEPTEAWYQGLSEMFQSIGNAFGDGMMQKVKDQTDAILAGLPNITNGWANSFANFSSSVNEDSTKTILVWLVKAICSAVLISQAQDKASAASCVGIMLGVDLLTASPFEWLKDKVCELIGVKRKQSGFGDWIKEFNATCQAARGLDWIGERIWKFIEWLKGLFEREIPARRQFAAQLKMLPDLMVSIDRALASKRDFMEADIQRLVSNMETLKAGADLFGLERSFSTSQIITYFNKAQQLKKMISQTRHEPVTVMIHGGPGTGKSLATKLIGKALSVRLGKCDPYCLPPDPKHFDGYSQQPVVIMDDVGQNPDGEDLKLFCQMVSSTEFIPPMATIEDKGKPFISEFVLCSTNQQELRPPTVAVPAALERRYFLDVTINVQREYKTSRGTLQTEDALRPYADFAGCRNFVKACPFVDGTAVQFQDKRNNQLYSLDEIVTKCMEERERRSKCVDMIDALFQGKKTEGARPVCLADAYVDDTDSWVAMEFDEVACRIETHTERQQRKAKERPKETPAPIIDLIRAVPNPDVLQWCIQQGYLQDQTAAVEVVKADVKTWCSRILTVCAGVAVAASIGVLVYKFFSVCRAAVQGPYTGQPTKVVKKPELKIKDVQAQGKTMEFETRLFQSSLFNVDTDHGHFTGLGLYDEWMLLPSHAHPAETVKVEGKEFKVVDSWKLRSQKDKTALELSVIKIDRPVKFRDIRKYIPETFAGEKDAVLLVNNENFRNMFCPVGTVSRYGQIRLEGTVTSSVCTYRFPTKAGQCGGVVVANNRIVAMHVGGDGSNGYAAILRRRYFEDLDATAKAQGEIVKTEKTKTPVNVSSKTSLRPSAFYDVFEGTKEPAALRKSDPRLEVDLDTAMFGKYKGNVDPGEIPELEVAVDHYVSTLKPLCPANLTEPLPLEEVVYGTDNLEGLDLNTSAGYPYVTMGVRKRDLIPERGEPLTKLQQALDLHGTKLPYITYLKDELRPLEKVKMGKTRLIECSSINDTIQMKMRLGRLFQVFHGNPGTRVGSAVGCNPDLHWSIFRAELGDNPILAFDYSNYDASLGPFWFEALKKVLTKLGFECDDLINHICYSKHIYRDREYDVVGGMPSGCSGTSIFNSIINNLIIRTLVLRCYKGIDLDSLKIIAYGDDVVATYPYALDAQVLADEGKKFGLTMTPADKSSCFNEVTWDNVTFLKRRFVPDEQFPFLIHPVFPMEEIHESIRWCRSAAHTQEHVASLCYLAWHAGEDVYNKFLEKVRSVPVGRALFLPEYSVLRRAWLDSF